MNFKIDLIEENKKHKKFCILPFVSMQIFGDQISPCCKCTVHHFNDGLSWNDAFEKYLKNQNLQYKQLGFLNGAPTEDCDRCFLGEGLALYPSNKFREYVNTLGDALPNKSKIKWYDNTNLKRNAKWHMQSTMPTL